MVGTGGFEPPTPRTPSEKAGAVGHPWRIKRLRRFLSALNPIRGGVKRASPFHFWKAKRIAAVHERVSLLTSANRFCLKASTLYSRTQMMVATALIPILWLAYRAGKPQQFP
jgi:hypothetical protein